MNSIPAEHFMEFPFADYLLVFISIIVGYVVTEFFAGWGGLIRNRSQVEIYWLHLLWTINFFIQLIENWWWMWGNRIKLAEHVGFFFFSLCSPLLFYLISVILFPSLPTEGKFDFKTYYYKNHRWLFLLFGLLMVVYFINNMWLRGDALWSISNIFCLVGLGYALLSAFYKSHLFHSISILTGTVIFVLYVILNSRII